MRLAISALIAAVLFTTLSNPCAVKPAGTVQQPQHTSGTSLLEHALRVARTYENDPSYLLGEIAIRYAGLGQFDRALDLADSIHNEGERELVRARIATIIRKSGDTKRAGEILDSIRLWVEIGGRKSPRYSDYILSQIAAELAACGAFERVFELVNAADDDYLRRESLDAVLDNFVPQENKRNDFTILSRVIQLSAKLGNGEDSAVLTRVAQKYAEAGQYGKALTVANSFAKRGNELSDFDRDDVVQNLAVLLAKRGDFTRAINLAESTDDYFKSQALIQIAKEQIAKAQTEAALKSLEKVTSPLLKEPYQELDFDDAGIGAKRLASAAVAYASAGYRDKAEKLLNIALDRARRVRKFTEQDDAVRTVAVSYAEAGMFEQAAAAAQPANFTYFKIESLAAVGIEMLRQDRHGEVQKVVTMIRDARIEERPELKADGLVDIAREYLARGEHGPAAEISATAFEIGRNSPVNDFQPGIMENIAVTLAEAGEYTKAVEVAAAIHSTFHQALALANIGVIQAKVGWVPDECTMTILNGLKK